nr:hypothetical protein [Mesorhizobium sp. B2-1-3A]
MIQKIYENKARQGRLGRPVLFVLLGGLLLALIAWGIAETYGEKAKSPGTQEGRGSGTDSPGEPPAQNDPIKAKVAG